MVYNFVVDSNIAGSNRASFEEYVNLGEKKIAKKFYALILLKLWNNVSRGIFLFYLLRGTSSILLQYEQLQLREWERNREKYIERESPIGFYMQRI